MSHAHDTYEPSVCKSMNHIIQSREIIYWALI